MNSFEQRIKKSLFELIDHHCNTDAYAMDRDGFVQDAVALFSRETRRAFISGLKARPKPGQRAGRTARSYNSAVKNGIIKPVRRDAKEKAAIEA
jgi:hypothetical protein